MTDVQTHGELAPRHNTSDIKIGHQRRSLHKSHLIVSISSLLKLNSGFKLHLGSLKAVFVKVLQNFIKSQLKICQVSQISVHRLWHV